MRLRAHIEFPAVVDFPDDPAAVHGERSQGRFQFGGQAPGVVGGHPVSGEAVSGVQIVMESLI